MGKPSFEEFLINIYKMSLYDYHCLSDEERHAIIIDYSNRYGSVKWWY